MNKIDLTSLTVGDEFEVFVAAEQRRVLAAGCDYFDIEELVEEIEHLGGSEEREIRNRMAVLLAHLLKWEFQPKQRSNSWRATVTEQRSEIAAVIRRNPSLRSDPEAAIAKVYRSAALKAARETGLPITRLPAICPYAVADILNNQFWPGAS